MLCVIALWWAVWRVWVYKDINCIGYAKIGKAGVSGLVEGLSGGHALSRAHTPLHHACSCQVGWSGGLGGLPAGACGVGACAMPTLARAGMGRGGLDLGGPVL